MKTRDYNNKDKQEVKAIFTQYWTDKDFLDELLRELDNSLNPLEKGYSNVSAFFVAEDDHTIVGIAGFRKAPEHLRKHADTKTSAELYIIASKFKNEGIGNTLGNKVIQEAQKLGFTEIICYSPETHNSSWSFYENLSFIKSGIIHDPDDGHPGMLWKRIL